MVIQTVSRAKSEVQKFAKDVIQWVGDVQAVFQSHKGGSFTRRTKKSLAKMRYVSILQRTNESCVESVILSALIDEICKWATARLVCLHPCICLRQHPHTYCVHKNDGRWSSITHGLSIAQEIDEFKSRIESARALFLVCLK
jgi:hypothetical protein